MKWHVFGKRVAGISTHPYEPFASSFIGVVYLYKEGGNWCISKRMSFNSKSWIHIHERHVPKKYKMMALLLGG